MCKVHVCRLEWKYQSPSSHIVSGSCMLQLSLVLTAKRRVDIEYHFGENLPGLPKVQEFPTSVGCFPEIAANYLNTLAQLVF